MTNNNIYTFRLYLLHLQKMSLQLHSQNQTKHLIELLVIQQPEFRLV
jgi:hypothetical protein